MKIEEETYRFSPWIKEGLSRQIYRTHGKFLTWRFLTVIVECVNVRNVAHGNVVHVFECFDVVCKC